MYQVIKIFIVAAICAAFFSAGCKKAEEKNPEAVKDTLPAITVEFLTGSAWGATDGDFGWGMKFKADGTYHEEFIGEGCGGYDGTYVITDNAVIINAKGENPCTPDNKPVVNRKCVLKKDDKSLFCTLLLSCDGYDYYRAESKVIEGKPVEVKGISALTTGPRKAVCKNALMFREKPEENAKAYTWTTESQSGVQERKKALPKDMMLTVLARTKDKVKVGKWENYWYYVMPDFDWYSSPDSGDGWVFGEFIGFVDK